MWLEVGEYSVTLAFARSHPSISILLVIIAGTHFEHDRW